jgi:hypothetical protein
VQQGSEVRRNRKEEGKKETDKTHGTKGREN